MTVSWSDVQQTDSYHLVVNGKVVTIAFDLYRIDPETEEQYFYGCLMKTADYGIIQEKKRLTYIHFQLGSMKLRL